ncbi:MAG: FAD-dependent oxidoreductase [Planctomycetota bacterium]
MFDVAVVGAGFAGLTCARALARKGRSVVVLEKAPRLGGRLATLSVDGQTVDSGAPFFVANGHEFRRFVEELLASDVARIWEGRLGFVDEGGLRDLEDGVDRFICEGGMPEIGRYLAEGLDLRLATGVRALERGGGAWSLHTESGDSIVAGEVVLALPSPLAVSLLKTLAEPSGVADVLEPLASVTYDPIIAAIALYEPGVPLPDYEGIVVRNGGPLEWIGVDSAIRKNAKRPALVIHGFGWWSKEAMSQTEDVALSELLFRAGEILGRWVEEPRARHLQRWPFAGPANRLESFWLGTEGGPRLWACGDFGPVKDLEGAYRSGMGAAAAMTG